MRISRFFVGALFIPLLTILPVSSAQSSPKVDSKTSDQSSKTLPVTVRIPVIDKPLRLSDFEAMKPSAALDGQLLHLTSFTQNEPYDGQPGTEETEVWAARTRTNLYFVFICHDRQPKLIRGHLARRENIQNDDNVGVVLDPFQDHRKGVLFPINPAGVQTDAAWSESSTSNPDYSYDTVWNSEGRVTPTGWIALIDLPFRSIRFNPASPNWGFVLFRNLPRNSEQDFWPRVAANISGTLPQEATMTGIEGVSNSHNVQLNPYLIGQTEKTLETLVPSNPYFSSRSLEGTAGGELKAVLKDRIVVDATINPDFSDIESDQPQFTVNQRYPVLFPELRPFFLENANNFATPINLIYTRNIVTPEYGARVTGKIGNSNFGLFATDDREPGKTYNPGDPLYGKRATVAVARFSQDLGKGSSIGAIYTDYEFGGGFNRVGGIDFTARVNNNWTFKGQMIESATRGTQDAPGYTAGPATVIQIKRHGHAFNMNADYDDFSSGFVTNLGFIQSANIRTGHAHPVYQWYPKSKVIQSYALEFEGSIAYDHSGNRVYRYLSFDPVLLLSRNTVLAPIFGENSDTVGPLSYPTLTHYTNFSQNFAGFILQSAPSTYLTINLTAKRSGNVNYYPLANTNPFLLDEDQINFAFSIQPLHQLTTDNIYLLDRNHRAHTGAFVYESQIFRTKINYQFTRSISARIIAEYDSTLANPNETSLSRTKQIQTGALLSWLPHPGTALYIGYNNDIQNLDHSLCTRLSNSICDPSLPILPRSKNYLNDGKQIFVKASYLFRF
jgi:hypothetical protein